MATRTQKIRLGIFMLLALVMFVGTVGALVGLQLWNPKNIYFAEYRESVSGLEVGAAVKMKGVRVGRVETVRVTEDTERVRVTFAIDPGTPITVDTEAVVMSLGITGLKFIELAGGTAKSKKLAANGTASQIKAGASVLQTLTGKATDIAQKVEMALNNVLVMTNAENRGRITTLIDNASRLATVYADLAGDNKKRVARILTNLDRGALALLKAANTAQKLVAEASPSIRSTLVSAETAANSIKHASQGLHPQATLRETTRAAKALRSRIEDPGLTRAIVALQTSALTFGKLTQSISSVVHSSNRQLSRILTNLNDTSANFRSFSRAIRERPSLLLGGQTLKERKIR